MNAITCSRHVRPTRRKQRQPAHRFTLVELLVVLAILCILTGLLLPALHQSLNTARDVMCTNNLKQVAATFQEYANHNYGLLPSVNDGASAVWNTGRWYTNQLALDGLIPDAEYVNQRYGMLKSGVWRCPFLPEEQVNSGGGGYGVIIPPAAITTETHIFPFWQKRISLAQVRTPSIFWLIGDGQNMQGETRPIVHCPKCSSKWDTYDWAFQAAERHPQTQGGCNAFVDGHATSFSYLTLKYSPIDFSAHKSR